MNSIEIQKVLLGETEIHKMMIGDVQVFPVDEPTPSADTVESE